MGAGGCADRIALDGVGGGGGYMIWYFSYAVRQDLRTRCRHFVLRGSLDVFAYRRRKVSASIVLPTQIHGRIAEVTRNPSLSRCLWSFVYLLSCCLAYQTNFVLLAFWLALIAYQHRYTVDYRSLLIFPPLTIHIACWLAVKFVGCLSVLPTLLTFVHCLAGWLRCIPTQIKTVGIQEF